MLRMSVILPPLPHLPAQRGQGQHSVLESMKSVLTYSVVGCNGVYCYVGTPAFQRKMLLLSPEPSLMSGIALISESSVYMNQFARSHIPEDGCVLSHP